MATAFQHVKVTPDGVCLTLSQTEAEVLATVLGSVAGNTETTHRKTCDDIRRALEDAGAEIQFSKYPSSGTITFTAPAQFDNPTK